MRFLFLALTPHGWGETAFGLHCATALMAQSHEVFALIRERSAALLTGTNIPHQVLGDPALPFLGMLVEDLALRMNPDAIVLCDIVTTERTFRLAGVDPDVLTGLGIPVIGVDTWDSVKTGSTVDLFGTDRLTVATWEDRVRQRVYPVPFLAFEDRKGVCRFLPPRLRVARRVRQHIRSELGLADGDRLVLLCTADWQHSSYGNADGQRIGLDVPKLLARYLSRLGPRVHLLHVGPVRYDLGSLLEDRYHWMPPQPPEIMTHSIASADMVLSGNPSAATMVKAVVQRVPILVFRNSISGVTLEDIEVALGKPVDDDIRPGMIELMPIFRFVLWPLGYYEYLHRLIAGSEWSSNFRTVELLDGDDFVSTSHELLFGSASRDALLHDQEMYVRRVEELADPAATLIAEVR